ncbi:MAG: NAD(P)/FAD-dependent oxidoreductase [Rubrivivax sp.]
MEHFDVLIVGAGVSGIGLACTLKAKCPGKRVAILERRPRLGGTWDLFRYPGVRSDSDMLTYGYRFKPWLDARVLADGGTILAYLAETVREHGVDRHIRYCLKVVAADWSSTRRRWTVTAINESGGGESRRFEASVLVMCSGYYNFDAGYTPDLPGLDRFTGRRVHAQHWPQDLDLTGQRVVVVGSGATAMTLVPAIAPTVAHVTMLQRSPSYVLSVPSFDALTERLSRIVPRRWAFALARKRNTALARWIYQACRRWPQMMRQLLIGQARKRLAGSATDIAHFTPRYMPWDQRLCIVPDADLFTALRSGKASVETDTIEGFVGDRITLASGKQLQADVLVLATGLNVQVFGGARISVDGKDYAPQDHMLYKGVLLEDLPNFAWIVGYTSLSWTLKADLASGYLCRLLRHLDAHELDVFCARDTAGSRTDASIMDSLSSGYITRAHSRMPRQGKPGPWQVGNHYPGDRTRLLDAPIADGTLTFERRVSGRVSA